MSRKILLDFGDFQLEGELFDNQTATRFYKKLPYNLDLTTWGGEAYGDIGIDHGTEKPLATIPAGGIAYTNRGNYLCLFYGQTPAWPVEYIGTILNWEKLKNRHLTHLKVTAL